MNLFQVARINEGRFSCLNSRSSHRSALQVSQLSNIQSRKRFYTKREAL